MSATSTVASKLVLRAPILVVEDEPLLQTRLLNVLSDLGYQRDDVFVADSLAQADHLLANHSFPLAFIDLSLPDGSGLAVISRLRQLHPAAYILVFSAWSTPTIIYRAIRAGACGFVLKERDDSDVAAALRCALRDGATIEPHLAREILQQHQSPSDATGGGLLSQEDVALLRLTADGWSLREIREKLGLSREAIDQTVLKIYRSLYVA